MNYFPRMVNLTCLVQFIILIVVRNQIDVYTNYVISHVMYLFLEQKIAIE